jgi:hypothetical protein
MSDRTKKVLEELYALDPTLKDHEPALLAVLERLAATKPDVRIDQVFLAKLRTALLATPAAADLSQPSKNIITNLFDTMSKTPFILGGLAMTAILVAVIVTLPGQAPSQQGGSSQFAMAGIVDAAPGAFGDLSSIGQQGASPEAATAVPAPEAPNAAIEPAVLGTAAAISARPMGVRDPGISEMSIDSKMMVRPWSAETYTLAYDASQGPYVIAEQPVYRRSMDTKTMSQFASTFTGRSNGILNLAKLSDLRIESVSLFEDREDGYSMQLNLSDGSAYLGLDWRHQQYDPSLDEPLRPSDMPSDESLIAAANEFMDRFAINRSAYGEPFVEKTWQRYVIMAAADQDSPIAPSTLNVVYPLLIDGTEVTEFGGEESGPRVSIRARDLKVMNLYGLSTLRFERSPYELETDIARITAFAEKGGLRGAIYQPMTYDDQGNPVPSATEAETLRLGAPGQILLRMFTTVDNASVELYLPALRFPILNLPTDPNYYGPQDVVVPLVKSILDEQERAMDQPPVAIPYGAPEQVMIK